MRVLGFMLLSMFVFSCCNDHPIPSELMDKYVKGEIIIRAEDDYPLGLIHVTDIFSPEGYLESPNRAIMYRYDREHVFDLQDTVYFKIGYENGMQMAKDVKGSHVQEQYRMMSKRDLYRILNKFHFNLHNADPHREGPQHKIRHRRPQSNKGLASTENSVYIIEFVEPATGVQEWYYVWTTSPDQVVENTNYFLSLSNISDRTLDPDGYTISDPTHVYEMSLTHDHTF